MTNVTTNSYTDTNLVNGTRYYYQVTAVNTSGESPKSNEASAIPSADVRVNAGGAAYTAADGRLFLSDRYYTGGITPYSYSTRTISGTTDPTLYLSVHYGTSFSYSLPAPNGSYTLKLHFAECSYNASGQRLFNVSVNGTAVLTSFDVWAAAGGINKALIKTFAVTVSNGALPISFVSVRGNAVVSAIELIAP